MEAYCEEDTLQELIIEVLWDGFWVGTYMQTLYCKISSKAIIVYV